MKLSSMGALMAGAVMGIGTAAVVGMSSRHTRKRLKKMAECSARRMAHRISELI